MHSHSTLTIRFMGYLKTIEVSSRISFPFACFEVEFRGTHMEYFAELKYRSLDLKIIYCILI